MRFGTGVWRRHDSSFLARLKWFRHQHAVVRELLLRAPRLPELPQPFGVMLRCFLSCFEARRPPSDVAQCRWRPLLAQRRAHGTLARKSRSSVKCSIRGCSLCWLEQSMFVSVCNVSPCVSGTCLCECLCVWVSVLACQCALELRRAAEQSWNRGWSRNSIRLFARVVRLVGLLAAVPRGDTE